MIMSQTKRVFLIASALTMVVVGLSGAAIADEIKYGGINYKGVNIVGMKDGKIYFESPAGEKAVELGRIEAMKLAKYPDLSKADELSENKDYPGAAKLYSGVVGTATEDYLKILAGAKYVHALDLSGQYSEAVREYAKLITVEGGGPIVVAARPRGIPTDKAVREKMVSEIEADLKATKNEDSKKYLKTVLDQVKNPAAAAAAAAGETPDVGGNGLLDPGAAQRDIVAEMIQKGQADEALKGIDAALNRDGSELSKLYFQRGQAQAALKQDMESILSFMRVVIHFPRSSYAGPAMVEAGKVYKKLGKNDQAAKLWQDALKTADANGDETKVKEIKALLGSVK